MTTDSSAVIDSSAVMLVPPPSQPQTTKEGAPGPAGCAANLGLLAVMMVLVYFLILRPQQKQQKAHQSMLNNLKKGSMVRTRGGIRGEVTQLGDQEVTIEIADKVRVNVLRSHIASAEQAEEGASKK